jgi:predicted Zn-ribbon and HTH transcriptional regulator
LEVSQETFMLLRLNFLGSKERKEWWKKREPNALFVLSERPNFVVSIKCSKKCGYKKFFSIEEKEKIPKECPSCSGKITKTSSDSCEYAWFYWGLRHSGIIHI